MKLASKLHDAWHSFTWWLEGECHYYKSYWPELKDWILFAVCLAALCFVLGVSAGMMLG